MIIPLFNMGLTIPTVLGLGIFVEPSNRIIIIPVKPNNAWLVKLPDRADRSTETSRSPHLHVVGFDFYRLPGGRVEFPQVMGWWWWMVNEPMDFPLVFRCELRWWTSWSWWWWTFQVGLKFFGFFHRHSSWFEFCGKSSSEVVRPNWSFDSEWDRDVSAYSCFNVWTTL